MKKFLIIGNLNSITYKDIFPFIKSNELWLGHNTNGHNMSFLLYDKMKDIAAVWITNLDYQKRHIPLELHKHYKAEECPKYDNYDAINVDRVKDIPKDYNGVMGVPITFLEKYCPSQFEIIGVFNRFHKLDEEKGQICGTPIGFTDKNGKTIIWNGPTVNKKSIYKRVLIRLKK